MTSFGFRSRPANVYDLIPPERRRPQTAAERLVRPVDAEDAEFVVIREVPGRGAARPVHPIYRQKRPHNDNGRGAPPLAAAWQAAPLFRAVAAGLFRGTERLLGRLSVDLFSALVAFAFIAVFVLCGGFSALSGNGRGRDAGAPIAFTHVTVSPRTVNGMPMMVVSGIVENRGTAPLVSPRLRADVRSGGYMLSSTLFNPRLGRIETGESRGFQIKLPHAGGKTPEVELSLAE